MKIAVEVSPRGAASLAADALCLFVHEGGGKPALADDAATRALRRELDRRGFKPKLGRVLRVVTGEGRSRRDVIVCGLGKTSALDAERFQAAVAGAARAAVELRQGKVAVDLPPVPSGMTKDAAVRLTALALRLASYRFDRYLSDESGATGPKTWVVGGVRTGAGVSRALAAAESLSRGIAAARDLVNEPAGTQTPAKLASEVRRLARGTGLTVRVLGPAQIKALNMNALLAVAHGSDEPPRVVHMKWKPRGRPTETLAFIGKGVTFDSGGYNLKGGAHIMDMKSDMAGAAAVVGSMIALARLKPRAEIHGIVGLVENMVSGRAYKPGDVLMTRSGTSVEVNNTDAEGRLVLADLLDWCAKTLKPDAMVDLATLTGACVVALGPSGAGLMTNDDAFGERVRTASSGVGERMWPLPLWDDYMEQLASDIADMRNTGTRYGGALTAGLFLRTFVDEKMPWVHLDIAGPAFLDKPHAYWGKGGTGFGVATLAALAAPDSCA